MSRTVIQVLHGPNLNLLGSRQPELYGAETLDDIHVQLDALGAELGVSVQASQHNLEGELVDAIQQAASAGVAGILINPGAYTHTSVAIRDALLGVGLPTVEVHLTNVYARESFRHHSFLSDIVVARIMGFGSEGYLLALRGLVRHIG